MARSRSRTDEKCSPFRILLRQALAQKARILVHCVENAVLALQPSLILGAKEPVEQPVGDLLRSQRAVGPGPAHILVNGRAERFLRDTDFECPVRTIPDPHYPFHDRTVVVTSCGRICLYRKKINLSKSLAGQAVGIKEVDIGIWLVSFMEYDLGFIDLEEKTLQPLENPFGPKVLPMS